MTRSNGLSFTNKHILSETSLFRPAIAALLPRLAWTERTR
jgi:hypothetical protein